MKSFRELFEQYSKGKLPDDKVEGLNQELMETYFSSPEDLNQQELEYTEDLVFELYASNNLDDSKAQKLKEKFEKDISLYRKYTLLKNISEGSQTAKEKRLQQAFDTETEEKEEAELKEVLEEVIEKVHADAKQSQTDSSFEIIVAKIKAFFRDLIPSGIFYQPQVSSDRRQVIFQPQVKLVMVLASVALMFVVVWWSVNQHKENLFADNIRHGKISGYIDKTFEASPHINFSEISSRHPSDSGSQQQNAIDKLKLATEKYNEQDYSGSIVLFDSLIKSKSFNNNATISMMNFYLGNSYLAKGLDTDNEDLLKLSIKSFKEISEDTKYYQPSLWYSAFAYAKIGKDKKALRLLNALLQQNYLRSGEVQTFRDSLQIFRSVK